MAPKRADEGFRPTHRGGRHRPDVEPDGRLRRAVCRGLTIRKAVAAALQAGAVIVAALSGGAAAHAQTVPGTGEEVVLSASRDDMQFLAGRSVTISADVRNDVVAAGQDVTIDGAEVGTAIIAGYEVSLVSGAASDLISVADRLSISGEVQDDMIAAARRIAITSSGTVTGDARLAAETLQIDGRMAGSLKAAARRIVLNGTFETRIDVIAQHIVIGENAQLRGGLEYRSPDPPQIAEGAQIDGEITRKELNLPDLRKIGLALIGIGLVLAVSWLICVIAMLSLIQAAFPGLGLGAATRALDRPLASLGLGVAVVLGGLVLSMTLIVSVLGLPAGLALLPALAMIKLFGLAAASLAVGLLLRRALRGPGIPGVGSQIGWLIAGTIVLVLVLFIPFVGGLVALLVLLAGIGAMMAEAWVRLRPGGEAQ
ncbi:polymer-forming cytoskeletal protein [Amorphus orientalis]|uniref:Cytoskeletal protein CcmA (Bactofilin family) n=1 Tax=Amorphus orientalis TaxID=649198 RepID=A0AAE3VKQ2_9HYPH|nr:polymer-forming cytoskeletal protein [Amorphus orientalis]MDQ0313570.1 cytoskeletal protein CcmA (bactofilin family) [Amorphus orientalis]